MHLSPRPERSLHPASDNTTGRRGARRTILAALTAATAVLVAACGSSSSPKPATHAALTPASAPASASVSDPAGPARVQVRNTSLGRIIVDGHGRTLYMFGGDHADKSRCTATCAHLWPPYTTTGRPTSGPGAKRSLLGVTHAADGQSVVTYRGHPLYRFIKDTGPGRVNGEDVSAFGGRWDALSPAGTRITKRHKTAVTPQAAAPPTATTQAPPPPATTKAAPPPTTTTQAAPPPTTTTRTAPLPSKPSGSGIPQGGGGDGDLDNHGGPSDGDGNL